MSLKISMTVNGKSVSGDIEPRTLLVDFIRDTLRLTGTHVGCDTAQCGACTIHMNGKAVKCCNILAMQASGADIVTIEGIAKSDGTLHPMQEAFRDNHGLQCGFCTPGHGDERDRSRAQQRRASPKRRSAPGSMAICAAAPAITTS